MNIIIEEVVSTFPVRVTEEVFNIVISDSVSFLRLTDVADKTYVGKDGYVPVVNETTKKLELRAPSSTGGGVPEAPSDGKIRGRKDAAWVEIPIPTLQIITDQVDGFTTTNPLTSTYADGRGVSITPTEGISIKTRNDIDNSANIKADNVDHTDGDVFFQLPAKTVGEYELATKDQLLNKADLVGGLVPSSQLPPTIDEILEYSNLAAFPVTGESNKYYLALDTNKTYRWTGSTYAGINEGIALGETSSTAYRGDRGKVAYDHSQESGNPHGTTAAQVGAPSGSGTSTGTNTGDQDLSGLMVKSIVVSSNTTATNDTNYTVVANATFTDPSPVEAKGFVVYVRNGTATIGGIGYGVGKLIYRIFHSGAWENRVFVDETQIGSATVTALANKTGIIAKKATDSSPVTGVTTEQILESISIPANTLAVGDIVRAFYAYNKSASAGTTNIRLRVNTANSLSGASLIASSGNVASGTRGQAFQRHINVRTGVLEHVSSSVTVAFENGGQSSARDTTTFDPTVNNWFLITCQNNTNSADSTVCPQYTFEKL
jgi:hypothetical protein